MNSNDDLTILKAGQVAYPQSPEEARLESFDNPSGSSEYTVEFETCEFTSLCPVTGQPDFASIKIRYVPDKKCIESKSFKLYLFSFRNHKGFAEAIVNRILDDIVAACSPVQAQVTGSFTPRGGISIKVEAEYRKDK